MLNGAMPLGDFCVQLLMVSTFYVFSVLGTGLELVIALSIIGAGLLIFFIIIVCVCVRRKKPGKVRKLSKLSEVLCRVKMKIPKNTNFVQDNVKSLCINYWTTM